MAVVSNIIFKAIFLLTLIKRELLFLKKANEAIEQSKEYIVSSIIQKIGFSVRVASE